MMESRTIKSNFRTAFEALPGFHLLFFPNYPAFSIAAVSDSILEVTSINRDSVYNKGLSAVNGFLPFLHPDYLRPHFEECLKDKVDFKGEIKIDQKYFPALRHPIVRLTIKCIRGEDNEIEFVLLTLEPHSSEGSHAGKPKQPYPESFSNIIFQAPVAMAVVRGKNFVIELANHQMLKLWGKEKEIIGLPILQALPELVNQPFPQLMKNVYESGIEYHGVETPAHLRHGSRLLLSYFNFIYTPLKNEDGEVFGVMMVATDVTNLVKSRKELEESERRYRELISKATVATAIYVGENMVIRLANEAMLNLWGKTSKVIGKPLRQAVPELEGQPFHTLLERVYKTGITYHSTEDRADLMVNDTLQTFYFNFTYKALRDANGKIYGILNMAVDVTAMVKTRMEINDAEERWRIALQSAELGTWDYYPKTKEFHCSVRTKELFGLPGSARVSFLDLIAAIHPRDKQRLQLAMKKALQKEQGGHYRIDYAVTGIVDRKIRWQRATGQVFYDENGQPTRVTGTVLDITERKHIEEALEERVLQRTKELMQINKELERSNLELEQYAYVASHDLQEPLRKILVYSDLLQNELTETSSASVRLQKIMNSANRMSALIQDLLDFSKLIKSEEIFKPVDLNVVVKNVRDDFELKIQETGAIIEVDPLPIVEASSQQMNQMFYNLIGNALKFRKDTERPLIKISAHEAVLPDDRLRDLNPNLKYFEICVADNGIGFSPKYNTQIFEIFKRLHGRSRYEGTGIGLALCRKIARNHNGDILAVSNEGMGATFHVVLPKKQLGSVSS
jgi:PAS domain S-box-containing protein